MHSLEDVASVGISQIQNAFGAQDGGAFGHQHIVDPSIEFAGIQWFGGAQRHAIHIFVVIVFHFAMVVVVIMVVMIIPVIVAMMVIITQKFWLKRNYAI